ncbi:MAG: sugar transferase [Cyanobacteria bacterium REEB459]|nr:sugar transferase [Cyanobacteria bacterium REEB459]
MASDHPANRLSYPSPRACTPPGDIRAPRRLGWRDLLSWSTQRSLLLVFSDLLSLGLAWYLALSLNHFFSPMPPPLVWWVWLGFPSPFWLLVTLTLGLFASAGLYGGSQAIQNYLQAGKLVSLVYLTSLVGMYVYDPKLDLPRSLFFSAWLSSMVLVVMVRLALITLVLRPLEKHHAPRRCFLIAPAHRLRPLAQVLRQRAGLSLVGAALVSTVNSLPTYQAILASKATLLLVEGLPTADLASTLYWKLRRWGIVLQLLPNSRDMLYWRGLPETIAGLPSLRLDTPLMGGWDYRLKRTIDYLAAGLGLALLAPLLLAIALAIRLDSAGPVCFQQQRVGLQGKPFPVWKFRTMVVNASAQQAHLEQRNTSADGILFKLKADPRITRVGTWLRRTSLDELPQLINVLRGEMSLVGPRPLPLRDVARFHGWHHTRHQVLPGITGLWQVSGRSDIDSFDDVVRLDLHYIDHWSLNLDLEILATTLGILLRGKGAY